VLDPQNSPASISFEDVTAGYGTSPAVISDFSLSLDAPVLARLTGANGSGKSTVLELLSGYLRPRLGLVKVNGFNASSDVARVRRRICRTTPALYPSMTARDHIVLASRSAAASPASGLARAREYGLAPWLESATGSLSTGNQRKLWLIMCSLGDFDVIVLDEPFNGLDDEGGERLQHELSIWSKSKLTLIVAHTIPMNLPVEREVQMEKWSSGRRG